MANSGLPVAEEQRRSGYHRLPFAKRRCHYLSLKRAGFPVRSYFAEQPRGKCSTTTKIGLLA